MREDGRWKGRLTSRPLPDDDLTTLAVDDETRATIVRMWMGRSAAERRAGDSFIVVRDALEAMGADVDSIALADRAIDDEVRHAEICRVVASRFAGRELEEPERLILDVPKHVGASPELRRSLHVFGQCALNETTASAFLETCLAQSTVPLPHAALRELLSDEIDHARIGWAHLASLDGPSRAAVTPWLLPMMSANLAMWRESGAPPKPSALLSECGVPSKAAIDGAVLGALRDLVIPGLEQLGYDVRKARAWAAAGAPITAPRSA